MVTITLEEYKELLLKEKPTDKDRELLKRILDAMSPYLNYTSETSLSTYGDTVSENIKCEKPKKVIVEILNIIKYVDFELYMKIWNSVMTHERNRKAQEEQIEQMNQAKALRKENGEE